MVAETEKFHPQTQSLSVCPPARLVGWLSDWLADWNVPLCAGAEQRADLWLRANCDSAVEG